MITEKRLNEIVQALFKCKAELQKRFPFVCWFAAGWFPTAADAEYLRCPPVREGAYVNVELFADRLAEFLVGEVPDEALLDGVLHLGVVVDCTHD